MECCSNFLPFIFQVKLIKFTSISKKFKTLKYNFVKFREFV